MNIRWRSDILVVFLAVIWLKISLSLGYSEEEDNNVCPRTGKFKKPAQYRGFGPEEMEFYKNASKEMFYHGWNHYMDLGYPSDELTPCSCEKLDANSDDVCDIGRNDVLGGYGVTLVDAMDMLAIVGDHEGFTAAVEKARNISFDNSSAVVQVFETTIRGIGGLLSAHLYATMPRLGHQIEGYDGHLLRTAYDLGERLLKSFVTESGIPLPRIGLKDAILPICRGSIVTETCTAGAGSLILEFGLLSKLTGDGRFEKAANNAFWQVWDRRSSIDLVAMGLDSVNGQWKEHTSGIGASIDSFYEYALKYWVLFNDDRFLKVFRKSYKSLNLYSFDGFKYRNIYMHSGDPVHSWIDSLGAFFPGLQVLYGDLQRSIKTHLTYLKLWKTYGGIPERWMPTMHDSRFALNLEWYPLRPEFMESNYYLYQATKDPLFLQIGEDLISDLNNINRVKCGFSGVQNLRDGSLSNRMESFFLSETMKYLYLLFDRTNKLNKDASNFVFSTEAHPFWYDKHVMKYSSTDAFPGVASFVRERMREQEGYGTEMLIPIKPQTSEGLPDFFKFFKDIWRFEDSHRGGKNPLLELYKKNRISQQERQKSSENAGNGHLQPRLEEKSDSKKYWKTSPAALPYGIQIASHSGDSSHNDREMSNESGDSGDSHSHAEMTLPQDQEITDLGMCEVWQVQEHRSAIASWKDFYALDSTIALQQMPWLDELVGKDRFHMQKDFYAAFTDSDSVCDKDLYPNMFEIYIDVPQGRHKTRYRVSKDGDLNLQFVESVNLHGVKLLLSLSSDIYGKNSVRINKFQDILVNGQVLLGSWPYNSEGLLTYSGDCVKFLGIPVTNMQVDETGAVDLSWRV